MIVDPIFGVAERRLTQPEPSPRSERLSEMMVAEDDIKKFLNKYKYLFPDEIWSFLTDIHFAVQDYEEGDE